MSTVAPVNGVVASARALSCDRDRTEASASALRNARRISREVAAVHASDVDAAARFPTEVFDALKSSRLLSAPLPCDQGAGMGLLELGAVVSALAEGCASSAMVLAMHYSQLVCLMRHGPTAEVEAALRTIALEQHLVASITSEVGTSGDTRRSLCAVQRDGGQFALEKAGTTGSYCEHADAVLVTARADSKAPENDQVLVLLRRDQYRLEPTTPWNTLGMRGTCSPGIRLRGAAPVGQILPVPFADISAHTMVPYAHVLWSAVWTGIVAASLRKATDFVRNQAKTSCGTLPPGAARLAALAAGLQTMRDAWRAAAADYDALVARGDDAAECSTVRWALRMNNLKIATSEAAPRLVHEALLVIGVAAYRNDGPFSLGREYRDALSGALMISNDRISAANASLLLVARGA